MYRATRWDLRIHAHRYLLSYIDSPHERLSRLAGKRSSRTKSHSSLMKYTDTGTNTDVVSICISLSITSPLLKVLSFFAIAVFCVPSSINNAYPAVAGNNSQDGALHQETDRHVHQHRIPCLHNCHGRVSSSWHCGVLGSLFQLRSVPRQPTLGPRI
jgi:hypothetical protein